MNRTQSLQIGLRYHLEISHQQAGHLQLILQRGIETEKKKDINWDFALKKEVGNSIWNVMTIVFA